MKRKMWFPIAVLCLFASEMFAQVSTSSFAQSSEYDIKVIKSFRQAPYDEEVEDKGNCASIAVIKATIATFGPANVFKSEQHSGGQYNVILRNNDSVTISDAELADVLGPHGSGFVLPLVDGKVAGDQAILDRANFIFAIMAKRSAPTVLEGMAILNEGRDIYYVPALLGLGLEKVKKGKSLSYIYSNGYHSVFATRKLYDDYGDADELGILLHGHLALNVFKDLESISFRLIDASPAT